MSNGEQRRATAKKGEGTLSVRSVPHYYEYTVLVCAGQQSVPRTLASSMGLEWEGAEFPSLLRREFSVYGGVHVI